MRSAFLAASLTVASQWSGVIYWSLPGRNFIASAASIRSQGLIKDSSASSANSTPAISYTNLPHIAKRGPEAHDVCYQRTVFDRGNYDQNGYRSPYTWWDAPEWYVWVNATCDEPGYSGDLSVYCKKVRHLGVAFDGRPFPVPGVCPEQKPICENTRGELDPAAPTGHLVPDVTCVTPEESRVAHIEKERRRKQWCSESEQLAAHSSRTGSSYQLTMEVQPSRGDRKRKGNFDEVEMWFEVVASWWKYSHRLADRVGRVTSAIINTAPALGKTTVRFCALLNADTTSYVLPRVTIIYSAALIGKHWEVHPPGGSHARTAIVIDVEKEPEDLVIVSN